MPVTLLMPRVQPAMQDGMIVKWIKNEGDPVAKGDIVLEITSEKASCEVESFHEGILYKTLANPGDVIPVNEPVAIIKLAKDTPEELAAMVPGKKNPVIMVEGKRVEVLLDHPATDGKIKASPLARRTASEYGINLGMVSGTGPGGRIIKQDVLEYHQSRSIAVEQMPVMPKLADKRIPLSIIRRETTRRLQASKDNVIPVTSVTEMDLTDLVKLYKDTKTVWQNVYDTTVTMNAFFIKAVGLTLRRHELLNSTLESDAILVKGNINIGLAMNIDDQLYVPVIRDADKLTVVEIARQVSLYIEKAKEKKLTLKDMQDGTFTITNVGPFDVQFSTPVIVYPQVGILGIGTLNVRPVYQGDDIVKRSLCYISLTYDHRAIDGVPAAGFRKTLKELLEQPLSLLN